MAYKPMVTRDRILELLSYDPETGIFSWKVKRSGRRTDALNAGTITAEGYRSIMIDGKYHRASRLAFLIAYGRWPDPAVDHINGDRLDNRLSNLREVGPQENAQNRDVHRNGRLLGTKRCKFSKKNPWEAQIRVNGKMKYIGIFPTEREAHNAYLAEYEKLYGQQQASV